MESVWYYARGGAQTGPVSFGELKTAATSGQLGADDLVWREGTPEWVPARSITGLFPSAAAPPAPLPSSPPPLAPPAMPTVPMPSRPAAPARAPAPAKAAPAEPVAPAAPRRLSEAPPGSAAAIVDMAKEFLRRTTAPNPNVIVPSIEEDHELTKAGYDPIVKRYAIWRRAVLWVAAVPTALAALFQLISLFTMDENFKSMLSGFGSLLLFVQAFALFALPLAAVFAALAYDSLARSIRYVLIGGLISLGVPLLVAFMPASIMLDPKVGLAGGPILGVLFFITLMPMVLALLPAVSRGCVRVKGFLPESLAPGWGLVVTVPVFVLFVLATFVVIYHTTSNLLLLLGLVLWIGAPLIYLTKFRLLTRPLTESQDIEALAKTQVYVLGTLAAGLLLLVIFLFDAKLVGTGKEPPYRPWSLGLHRIWIEYVGRSLFLTVMFADLVMKMAVMVWREDRAFAGTGPAANFDRTMSGLGEAIETKGVPPVA